MQRTHSLYWGLMTRPESMLFQSHFLLCSTRERVKRDQKEILQHQQHFMYSSSGPHESFLMFCCTIQIIAHDLTLRQQALIKPTTPPCLTSWHLTPHHYHPKQSHHDYSIFLHHAHICQKLCTSVTPPPFCNYRRHFQPTHIPWLMNPSLESIHCICSKSSENRFHWSRLPSVVLNTLTNGLQHIHQRGWLTYQGIITCPSDKLLKMILIHPTMLNTRNLILLSTTSTGAGGWIHWPRRGLSNAGSNNDTGCTCWIHIDSGRSSSYK